MYRDRLWNQFGDQIGKTGWDFYVLFKFEIKLLNCYFSNFQAQIAVKNGSTYATITTKRRAKSFELVAQ